MVSPGRTLGQRKAFYCHLHGVAETSYITHQRHVNPKPAMKWDSSSASATYVDEANPSISPDLRRHIEKTFFFRSFMIDTNVIQKYYIN